MYPETQDEQVKPVYPALQLHCPDVSQPEPEEAPSTVLHPQEAEQVVPVYPVVQVHTPELSHCKPLEPIKSQLQAEKKVHTFQYLLIMEIVLYGLFSICF